MKRPGKDSFQHAVVDLGVVPEGAAFSIAHNRRDGSMKDRESNRVFGEEIKELMISTTPAAPKPSTLKARLWKAKLETPRPPEISGRANLVPI